MTKKIANSIILVSIISLILAIILAFSYTSNYFKKEQISNQKDQLNILLNIANNKLDELFNISFNEYNVSIISHDGKILFDSKDSNLVGSEEKIENYQIGFGFDYNSTIIENKIYSAAILNNGDILRISSNELSSFVLIYGAMQPIFIFILIIIIISSYFAKRLSRNIIAPLKNINLKNPLENKVYDELVPLLIHLNKQKRELENNAEELNRKNLEILHITDNVEEAILILNKNGEVLLKNQKAQDLLGVELNEYYTKNFFDYDYHNVVSKALNGDSSSGKFLKNDRTYKITAKVSKLKNNERAVFVFFDDITMEEENINFRKEFSANVSHELKTPLSSIMGMSELIIEGIVKQEDTKSFARKINRESKRLLNLIQDIIKLSRLDENSIDKHFEDINLKNIIEETIISLESRYKEKNIKLTTHLENVKIKGIKQLIFDSIYNLIDNAINYNSDNGKIKINLFLKNKNVHFIIQDTGIGISKNDQKRVFERFYRVDKSHSKLTGGTGLGLAIVKNTLKIHDAQIKLSSELNVGTKIEIIFKMEE